MIQNDDTISRQAAISAICNACGKIDCDKMDKCEKLQLPPANCSEFPNNSDTISRQAAIRWVKTECNPYGKPTLDFESGKKVIEHLERMPPAQPEIVRCKDCRHYKFADNRAFGFPVKRCEWTGFEDIDDNDFCSRAERREE